MDQKRYRRYSAAPVKALLPKRVQALFDKNVILFVNPTGKFVIGGPHGDTGLTGRKIIVDTYGGKEPTVGELSPEKTLRKSIGLLPMLPVISLKIW